MTAHKYFLVQSRGRILVLLEVVVGVEVLSYERQEGFPGLYFWRHTETWLGPVGGTKQRMGGPGTWQSRSIRNALAKEGQLGTSNAQGVEITILVSFLFLARGVILSAWKGVGLPQNLFPNHKDTQGNKSDSKKVTSFTLPDLIWGGLHRTMYHCWQTLHGKGS